jgi:pimeloyl-ACP methyl ester carboxylesterase
MERENIYLQKHLAHYFFNDKNIQGEKAHFYPGNGLPTGVYKPLLNFLSEKYNLTSLAFRASWENSPEQNNQVNWNVYADDLISYLEKKYTEPIVGIGHSQGATATIIAAYKRPDLFKEIFLIEPVSVSKIDEVKLTLVPYFIKKKMEPFKSALKKKSIWDSPNEYLEFIESSKGFRRINKENLKILVEESLSQMVDGKFKLIFPVDWEVSNYALPKFLDKYVGKLVIPHKIIIGKPSLFLTTAVRKKWAKIVKGEIIVNNDFGHLIPLEAPEYCAEQILN